MPVPSVAAHFLESILGFPAELTFRFGGVGVAGGDVAGSSRFDAIGNLDAVDFLKSLYQLKHRVALTCAEVIDGSTAVSLDGFQCGHMAFGEVHHMDEVAHAGAVGGRIVIAEDPKLRSFAHGHLGDIRH